ncbi:MAG: FAD-dependent oxidoreductase [Betaproteobacteria bacterium]|nr:MAG: FAD-dependent oxidoreductase [Betaproteobacteria bacterium]
MKTIIIGGGPVGLATALALKERGATNDITVVEATPLGAEKFSDRNIALSAASWRFLSRVGVDVARDQRASIETVEISQRGAFGLLSLNASDVGTNELGAATPYPALKNALNDALAKTAIAVHHGATVTAIEPVAQHALVYLASGEQLRGDCIALADGAGSDTNLVPAFKRTERNSGQTGIITRVQPTRPRPGVAFERFTPGGALALIPRADGQWTVIWARPNASGEHMLAIDDESFSRELNAAFGSSMGALNLTAKRTSYPLSWRFVEPRVAGCIAALGNAAQGLHPVAAQGLNLGLRDADSFAIHLAHANARGSTQSVSAALAAFARGRAVDRVTSIGFTGVLTYAFDRGGWLADVPRGLGLTALQLFPPLKRELIARLALA